jgi:hypothetical protein
MVYMTFVFLESKGEHKRFCTGSEQEFPQIKQVSFLHACGFHLLVSFATVLTDIFKGFISCL